MEAAGRADGRQRAEVIPDVVVHKQRKTETDDGAVHVERHGAVEGGVRGPLALKIGSQSSADSGSSMVKPPILATMGGRLVLGKNAYPFIRL